MIQKSNKEGYIEVCAKTYSAIFLKEWQLIFNLYSLICNLFQLVVVSSANFNTQNNVKMS